MDKLQWDISAVTPHDFLDHLFLRLPFHFNEERLAVVRKHASTFIALCCTGKLITHSLTLKRHFKTFRTLILRWFMVLSNANEILSCHAVFLINDFKAPKHFQNRTYKKILNDFTELHRLSFYTQYNYCNWYNIISSL